jgi:eukaryotic-like serine/threonine-protein kinase
MGQEGLEGSTVSVEQEVVETRIGLREGDVLAGKYRVERVLGAGGMGVVVAAHHIGLDTKVAVKLLLPEMLDQEDVVARFAREARASARITNDHVARVFDVGALENGAPYMVMEFLDGSDLSEWLRRHGPLPVAQAVDFVLQACEAVAEAHRVGIVHRDLKPANLFCVRRPDGSLFVKVLDFGISKLSAIGAQSSLSMTSTAAVMGTPYYMSPEQMDSARVVDGRTDIWALGIVLFELLTGNRPFGGQTMPEVCISIATHPAPPVRRQRADVPPGVEAVILKCLEKQRTQRFSTIAEMASALVPFAEEPSPWSSARAGRGVTSTADVGLRTASAPDATHLDLSSQSLSALGHTKGTGSRRRPALIGLAGGALVLLVSTTVLFLVSTRPAAPDAGEPTRAAAVTGGPDARAAPAAAATPPTEVARLRAIDPPVPTAVLASEPVPQATARPRKADSPKDGRPAAPRAPAINPGEPATANPFDERL